MSPYLQIEKELKVNPRTWLITGVAGFIGSHLAERLLALNQKVIGIDNLVTGREVNLSDIKKLAAENAKNFSFYKIDINETAKVESLISDPEVIILHQAALGSVPRSIKDPEATHKANVNGFVSILLAAKSTGIKRIVYASSSSVYGDHPGLPKQEDKIGRPLSPYALSKLCNEMYAEQFSKQYNLACLGLRYFNVFGPRQDPNGVYAAVVPKWFAALKEGTDCSIFGDGSTSRDFCYVENVIQANLLAAFKKDLQCTHAVYNIACGEQLTLNELYEQIFHGLKRNGKLHEQAKEKPDYQQFRQGDIKHSLASIQKSESELGYQVVVKVREGIQRIATQI